MRRSFAVGDNSRNTTTQHTHTTSLIGSFTFVLHTHLPYVLHHGKWPHGSDWLSEAAAECYIPTLNVLEGLDAAGHRPRISMDFSPINLEQLADPAFVDVFTAYCDEKIAAAEKDHAYFATNNELEFQPLADRWREFYLNAKRRFLDDYDGNLVTGFRRLADKGILDAMTCGATHGYFPLLLTDANIRAQVACAIETHERHFGKRPRGIWLPECGYRPPYAWSPPTGPEEYQALVMERAGVEEILSEFGIEYFVADGALTKGGLSVPAYGAFGESIHELYESSDPRYKRYELPEVDPTRALTDIYWVRSSTRETEGTPPAVFSRDAQTAAQVWSADSGYPGNPPYLEFHKKHHNSGLQYWSVTGPRVNLAAKWRYSPEAASLQIESDALHFTRIVEGILAHHRSDHEFNGVVASPFDTELFGHWWFEGPQFLKRVMELMIERGNISLTNCAEALDGYEGPRTTIALPEGSWGEGNGHFVWLNSEVEWTWDSIYPLEDRFLAVLRTLGRRTETDDLLRQILEQAARELLLMEASDWQFVISTKGAIDYSTKRFTEHARLLGDLLSMAERYAETGYIDEADTELLESATLVDRPFSHVDLRWWLDEAVTNPTLEVS